MTNKPLITLERGKPYPLPVATQQGASAQFLMESGSVLQIVLPDMTAKEQNALRSGMILGGFLEKGGCILWLFQFFGKDGRPLFTMDCPFDARLLGKDKLFMPDITNERQRLAIEIHAIDEKNILRALRMVTLSPKMTLVFLSAVQDQLARPADSAVWNKWLQYPPEQLIKTAKTEVLGK